MGQVCGLSWQVASAPETLRLMVSLRDLPTGDLPVTGQGWFPVCSLPTWPLHAHLGQLPQSLCSACVPSWDLREGRPMPSFPVLVCGEL